MNEQTANELKEAMKPSVFGEMFVDTKTTTTTNIGPHSMAFGTSATAIGNDSVAWGLGNAENEFRKQLAERDAEISRLMRIISVLEAEKENKFSHIQLEFAA